MTKSVLTTTAVYLQTEPVSDDPLFQIVLNNAAHSHILEDNSVLPALWPQTPDLHPFQRLRDELERQLQTSQQSHMGVMFSCLHTFGHIV